MDSDEDELYEPEESSLHDTSKESINPPLMKEVKMDELEEGEEEGEDEEIEEDDSESDIEFITEKKEPSKEDSQASPTFQAPKPSPIRMTDPNAKSSTPTLKTEAPAPTSTTALKPGSEYPAYHTSTIDINADPVHPATGKPISSTDFDADFGENDKPWRRPGTDITDYFNYGFDEFTWASYCLKQQSLRKEVGNQKKEMEDLQSFFGGPGTMPQMPGMPGAPAAASAAPSGMMPGMPDFSQDMMTGMMGAMMSQGMDPSTMQPDDFMRYAQQYMQAMGGQAGGQGQAFGGPGQQVGGQQGQQQGGYGDGNFNQGGGGGGGGGGRGGRGRGGRRW